MAKCRGASQSEDRFNLEQVDVARGRVKIGGQLPWRPKQIGGLRCGVKERSSSVRAICEKLRALCEFHFDVEGLGYRSVKFMA